METLKKIYNLFPEINWKWLNYTNYPRIRFYFSSNENELPILLNNLQELLKKLFWKDNIYICLILYWNKRLPNNTIKSLKLRWIYNIVEDCNETLTIKNDDITNFLYFTKTDFNTINKLNKSLLEKDFWVFPELYLNCFYFNFDKKLLINLYDDRWMDIISIKDNKFILKDIYNSFNWKYKVKFE